MDSETQTTKKPDQVLDDSALLGEVATIIRKGFTPPFSYDIHGTWIIDANSKHVMDVRGWGHLQYLGTEAADEIQTTIGKSVASHLNKVTGCVTSVFVAGGQGAGKSALMAAAMAQREPVVVDFRSRHKYDFSEHDPIPFGDYSNSGLLSLKKQIDAKICKLSRKERTAILAECTRRDLI